MAELLLCVGAGGAILFSLTSPLFLRVVSVGDGFSLLGAHSFQELLGIMMNGSDPYNATMLSLATALLAFLLVGAAVFYWAATAAYLLINRKEGRMRGLAIAFSILALGALAVLGFASTVIYPQMTPILAHIDHIHAARMTGLEAPLVVLTAVVVIALITILFIVHAKRRRAL
ncbi:MAG: hypothetical protein LBG81_08705 [Coriobacteriaceae bacterium]|nr:hypothetical protein [Coriobacteriaceae bacterium]